MTLTNTNNDVLINYAKVCEIIREKTNEMCNGLEGECCKDLMKITVNSDDDLPLNKEIKFHVLTFTIRHVLKKVINIILNFF